MTASKSSFTRNSAIAWCQSQAQGVELAVAHPVTQAVSEWGASLNGLAPNIVWVTNTPGYKQFFRLNMSSGKMISTTDENVASGAVCAKYLTKK